MLYQWSILSVSTWVCLANLVSYLACITRTAQIFATSSNSNGKSTHYTETLSDLELGIILFDIFYLEHDDEKLLSAVKSWWEVFYLFKRFWDIKICKLTWTHWNTCFANMWCQLTRFCDEIWEKRKRSQHHWKLKQY